MEEMKLMDGWRIKHPNKKQYSWHGTGAMKVYSRLDYALMSPEVIQQVKSIELKSGYRSDHWRIEVKIIPITPPRGVGNWKLNTTFLQDKLYVEKINSMIDIIIQKEGKTMSSWERMKSEVAKESKVWGKKKAEQKRQMVNMFQLRLENLQKMLVEARSENVHKIQWRIARTKEFVAEEHQKGTLKAIFRSKAIWAKLGEKCTKYFLGLEQVKSRAKSMVAVENQLGEMIYEQRLALKCIKDFYAKLYTTNKQTHKEISNLNLMRSNELKEDKIDQLQKELTPKDLAQALKEMASNHSPGLDGLPPEFYKVFWGKLKEWYYVVYQKIMEQEELHETAKQGLLCLLPKARKSMTKVQDRRPITLLNTDYKILSKAVANKIKPIIKDIIHVNQTGFIAERNIADNLIHIRNVIQHANKNKMKILMISIDFKKCFDTIEHEAIFQALKFFKIPAIIIKYIKILLKDSKLKVVNNGHFSTEFVQTRGTKQGDPISSFIAVIVIEILARKIREHQGIKGIQIGDIEEKLSQLADDMNVFIKYEQESLDELFNSLDQFYRFAGLQISYEKTTIYRIGSIKDSNAKLYSQNQIAWTRDPVKILGIFVDNEEHKTNQHNVKKAMDKAEAI